MPTKPKSVGTKIRARTIMEPSRRTKLAPWLTVETKAPRAVFALRSWARWSGTQPPISFGWPVTSPVEGILVIARSFWSVTAILQNNELSIVAVGTRLPDLRARPLFED